MAGGIWDLARSGSIAHECDCNAKLYGGSMARGIPALARSGKIAHELSSTVGLGVLVEVSINRLHTLTEWDGGRGENDMPD